MSSRRAWGIWPAARACAEAAEVLVIGLFLIETVEGGVDGGVSGPPVGHDEAGELPVAFEDVVEQVVVLAGVDAVHQVVGAHDGLDVGILNADFESEQVAFAHAALVDLGVGGGAAAFLIVEGDSA